MRVIQETNLEVSQRDERGVHLVTDCKCGRPGGVCFCFDCMGQVAQCEHFRKLPTGGENMLQELTKGGKTSEFYIVLLVLAPWICRQFGLDMSVITDNADQLRQAIEAAHGGSDMPVWVAMAYVVGRKVLKWRVGK